MNPLPSVGSGPTRSKLTRIPKAEGHLPCSPEMADTPTIYEWAGGTEAFRRWLDTFYDLVEQEELLAPMFGGTVSEAHRDHVTAWWAEVMGGPTRYGDELGGYESMLGHHLGLAITAEQRLRFVTLLSQAADDA